MSTVAQVDVQRIGTLRRWLREALRQRRHYRDTVAAHDRATQQRTTYKGGLPMVRMGDIPGVPDELGGLVLAVLPTGRTLVLVDKQKTRWVRDGNATTQQVTRIAQPDALEAEEVLALVKGALGHNLMPSGVPL